MWLVGSSSLPRDRTQAHSSKSTSPNRWPTREFLYCLWYNYFFSQSFCIQLISWPQEPYIWPLLHHQPFITPFSILPCSRLLGFCLCRHLLGSVACCVAQHLFSSRLTPATCAFGYATISTESGRNLWSGGRRGERKDSSFCPSWSEMFVSRPVSFCFFSELFFFFPVALMNSLDKRILSLSS